MEERWEAVEEAERLFRGTSLRVQQQNIGIARLPDGTHLVQVGKALPGELAAWRYGTELERRRRKHLLRTGAAIVAGLLSGVWVPSGQVLGQRVVLRAGDRPFKLKRLERAEFECGPEGISLRMPQRRRWFRFAQEDEVRLSSADATMSRVLAVVNHRGATAPVLRGALDLLDRAGAAHAFARHLDPGSRGSSGPGWKLSLRSRHSRWRLVLPAEAVSRGRMLAEPTSLALEMALHEETERVALEGQLAGLELAWREAEEIARIADSLT